MEPVGLGHVNVLHVWACKAILLYKMCEELVDGHRWNIGDVTLCSQIECCVVDALQLANLSTKGSTLQIR